MLSLTRNSFITSRAWHGSVVGGRDMILRCASALEFLELFGGYMHESKIEVYAKRPCEYDNIDCCVVDTFDGIDFVRFGDVLCTSINQTFNDMFDDYENIDELSLIEGLSGYYFSNRESFDGLLIKPDNMERFSAVRDWAIEYYDEA